MPAPSKELLSQMAKTIFVSKGIKLPVDWSQPGDQYPKAFKESEIMGEKHRRRRRALLCRL